MRKKILLLHILSLALLIVPNLVYLICNLNVFKEAHAIALTMVAMVILSCIVIGALLHFRFNMGVWLAIVGAFVLALANISYVAGIGLLIEGIGLIIDGYFIKPIVINLKTKELEQHGKQVTYTRRID